MKYTLLWLDDLRKPDDFYLSGFNPIDCEHDVLYVCGVDLKKMDASVVNELVELGFIPGSNDDTEYRWGNLTQEEWEQRWPTLSDCFYSYKYGSC